MTSSSMTDIVISGAGMVGAALACALAPSGVRIQLLEQRPDRCSSGWQKPTLP